MKIAVVGTRGFPGVQGGVESHCEKLYPRLAKAGCEITVFTRTPYIDPLLKNYENVNLVPIECPANKFLEAIVHTFKSVFAAKRTNPDIVHFHAIGPSILIPFARFLGMRVVMTNHGPDYKRRKWGIFAKLALIAGEALGSLFANRIICISEEIAKLIKKRYGVASVMIPNGIEIPAPSNSEERLKAFLLNRGRYILSVGRFVPEKGFGYLIDAFKRANLPGWKLVIAGRADHESAFSRGLTEKALSSPGVILAGFVTGETLRELFSNAGLFALPSYYEGLPIALLEAMSYGLLCIASDIPANRNIGLRNEHYFKAGDVEALAEKIEACAAKSWQEEDRKSQIDMLRRKYDWNEIASRTLEVYKEAVNEA